MNANIYEGWNLCPDLSAKEMCFVARTYKEGAFEVVFHEHVPKSRITEDSAREVLRSLVARYAEWPGTYILHSMLNKRGQDPAAYPFMCHQTYPEPGVMRFYVGEQNAHAWFDMVISKSKFRPR